MNERISAKTNYGVKHKADLSSYVDGFRNPRIERDLKSMTQKIKLQLKEDHIQESKKIDVSINF